MQCWTADPARGNRVQFLAELLNEGIIRAECPDGHKTIYVTQNPTFEMLFELGCAAVAQSEYREGVATMSAAWDTFRRFCVELVLRRSGLAPELAERIADKDVRHDKHGAFTIAYAVDTREAFPHGEDLEGKLRNRVTHDGYIPSRDEAMRYGEALIAVIHATMIAMHFDRADCEELWSRHLGQKYERLKRESVTKATLAQGTLVGIWNKGAWGKVGFRAHVESFALGHPLFQLGPRSRT